jgi:hypothetical protein
MAAETYRANPAFDTEAAIREVGVGEAVTSMLQRKGVPGVVQRTLIRPPSSQLGPISSAQRAQVIAGSDLEAKYRPNIDRHSACEMLAARANQAAQEAEQAEAQEDELPARDREFRTARRYSGTRVSRSSARRVRSGDSFGQAMGKMVMKELTGTTGRRIVRGILGNLFKAR